MVLNQRFFKYDMNKQNDNERLMAIMEAEKMSAREFANALSISPATLSNISNGRNKPSLDLLQRACNRFRVISSDWLFLGVGPMYRQAPDAQEQVLFDVRPENPESESQSDNNGQAPIQSASKSKSPQVVTVERVIEKKIKKIVVFFDDGTFQELENY